MKIKTNILISIVTDWDEQTDSDGIVILDSDGAGLTVSGENREDAIEAAKEALDMASHDSFGLDHFVPNEGTTLEIKVDSSVV